MPTKEFASTEDYAEWLNQRRSEIRIIRINRPDEKQTAQAKSGAGKRGTITVIYEETSPPGQPVLGKKCLSCGVISPAEYKFCIACGAPLFRPSGPPQTKDKTGE